MENYIKIEDEQLLNMLSEGYGTDINNITIWGDKKVRSLFIIIRGNVLHYYNIFNYYEILKFTEDLGWLPPHILVNPKVISYDI
ncbi:MAG: hypothetical protein FWG63_07195 [Defluviitaleaceae bacterium]|nr:hypothetical protein [Defluviitaleaceae bacterium]